jgi:hypothetical protein
MGPVQDSQMSSSDPGPMFDLYAQNRLTDGFHGD